MSNSQLNKISKTLTSFSFIISYTVSLEHSYVSLKHSISRMQRICKITSTILINILLRNLSLIMFTIENVRSTEAFEKGRVNDPRISSDIFLNFLFRPNFTTHQF